MTKAEQREAGEVLRRVVERIDQGQVEAPAWYRERLVGAMLVIDRWGVAARLDARSS
jgi:hypothetical protein